MNPSQPKQFIILPHVISERFKFDYGPHLEGSLKAQSIISLIPLPFTLLRNVINALVIQYQRPVQIPGESRGILSCEAREEWRALLHTNKQS